MNKVIVTGGAGYIGSHTCVKLIEDGYTPIIIDNLSNTNIKNLNGIEKISKTKVKFFQSDCCNHRDLEKIISSENNIIGAIHFAAFKSVEESMRLPEKYFKNNLNSLRTLIEIMNLCKVDNIIFSSSCTVYGTPDILPVDETAPFKKAESPYGETKQMCEGIINKSKISSVSLRYFNPIGSHKSGLIGDRSKDKPANLVPILCEVASGLRDKLIINGLDYDTTDGSCVRDYIHVEDLADAHLNALKYCIDNNNKSVFNIGTGRGLSVIEIVRRFEKINKLKLNIEHGPRRHGDVAEIYSDTKKSKSILNWKAKKSVDEALESAWKWELKRASN